MRRGAPGCWFLMWLEHWVDWRYALPQIWQRYGNSPVWIRRCLTTSPRLVKPRWQISQENGRSPVWLRRCTPRWVLREKASPQTSQTYGRSPVCFLVCFFRSPLLKNPIGHSRHWNGRMSLWVFECCFSVAFSAKDLPHSWHRYGLVPVCKFVWSRRRQLKANRLPQVSQMKFFSWFFNFPLESVSLAPCSSNWCALRPKKS